MKNEEITNRIIEGLFNFGKKPEVKRKIYDRNKYWRTTRVSQFK